MANLTPKTINELPALTSMSDADLMAVSSSSAAKRITWANLRNSIINAVWPYSSISAPLEDGISTEGTSVVNIQRCGKTAICTVYVNVTSGLVAGQWTQIATVPAGYWPRFGVRTICLIALSGVEDGLLRVTTSGQVQVAAYATVQSGDTAYVRAQIVWFVE